MSEQAQTPQHKLTITVTAILCPTTVGFERKRGSPRTLFWILGATR